MNTCRGYKSTDVFTDGSDERTLTSWFRSAYMAVCGLTPPRQLLKPSAELTDAESQELQDWCCCNPPCEWMTGIGTMEAIEHMVSEAIDNANLKRVGS